MIDFINSFGPEFKAAIVLLVLGVAGMIAGKTANPFDNLLVAWLKKKFQK